MNRVNRIHWSSTAVIVALVSCVLVISCRSVGRVPIRSARRPHEQPVQPNHQPRPSLKPIPRYGGTVLTAKAMPKERYKAYHWAKNMGTLVAYETFLRRYPDGKYADWFRRKTRERFVPNDREWQEAWPMYSQLETIDGAICDPEEGLIIFGRPGRGRLPPLFYDDLITALWCRISNETIGVTMERIFKDRFHRRKDVAEFSDEAFKTSVTFYSRRLLNTHLAYILFEGDRMLKSLGLGFDIFRGEPIRASVPGFATVVEMAAAQPTPEREGRFDYGRAWIELTSVKVNTTEAKNVAMFTDVKMEVRAKSEYMPHHKFAKHLEDHYDEYAAEFPIFAEVERTARIVAIAQWLSKTYPSAARRIIVESYEQVEVVVPQAIQAKLDLAGNVYLTGGVVLHCTNEYHIAPNAKVSETELTKVPEAVLKARPSPRALAWYVTLGEGDQDKYIAWNVSAPESAPLPTTFPKATDQAQIPEPSSEKLLTQAGPLKKPHP